MTRTDALVVQFLVNAAWQVVVLAGASALVLRLLRRAASSAQHRTAVIGLALCSLVPLVLIAGTAESRRAGRPFDAPSPGAEPVLIPSDDAAWWIARGYLGLVSIRWLALGVAAVRAARVRRTARAAPPAWRDRLDACAGSFGHPEVRLFQSSRARVPMVLGLRRPAIVLPDRLTDDRSAPVVLGHELAHIARRDLVSNLALQLLTLPIAFHPALIWLKRRVARTREAACDELAITTLGLPRPLYARELLRVTASLGDAAPRPMTVAFDDGRDLDGRIRRILSGPSGGRSTRRTRFAIAIALIALIATAVVPRIVVRAQRYASLSGIWRLSPARSTPTQPSSPLLLQLNADWHQLYLTQTRTTQSGRTESSTIAGATDGTPFEFQRFNGDPAQGTASWQGNTLIVDTRSAAMPQQTHNEVFARNGLLVIANQAASPHTVSRTEFVFERVGGQ